MARNEPKIEWGFAEALAFGKRAGLKGKTFVRPGQDVERGHLLSQDTLLLHGTESPRTGFLPLETTCRRIRVSTWFYNSFLSEFAVLGFEFAVTQRRCGSEALVNLGSPVWRFQK